MIVFWQRRDAVGVERMELFIGDTIVRAVSTVVCVEGSGFRLDYDWLLDGRWQTQQVDITRHGPTGRRHLNIKRHGRNWLVDGTPRDDLDGADEPDLSVTPFCNTLAIRRLASSTAPELTLDVAFIDGDELSVARSRQHYSNLDTDTVRYLDQGTVPGFRAEIHFGAEYLVDEYEGLFKRVDPTA